MEQNGKIMLTADNGSEEAFFVVEKAEIAGREYLLVTNRELEQGEKTVEADGDSEETVALILRVNEETAGEETILYDVVEDEKELTILSRYFEELVEDIDISL